MFKKRIQSFTHAFRGFRTLLQDEPNARIHLLAAITAISLGFYTQLSNLEWIVILFAIAIVIGAELVNSAIENLADLVSPEYHPLVKKAKDLGAAAVLISATTSLIVGVIIFGTKLF